jgi:hypothetical protein
VNDIPETCGKRPSRAGYVDTPFSNASIIAFPETLITITGSSKGKLS